MCVVSLADKHTNIRIMRMIRMTTNPMPCAPAQCVFVSSHLVRSSYCHNIFSITLFSHLCTRKVDNLLVFVGARRIVTAKLNKGGDMKQLTLPCQSPRKRKGTVGKKANTAFVEQAKVKPPFNAFSWADRPEREIIYHGHD